MSQYAEIADLEKAIQADALAAISTDVKNSALQTASAEADDYLQTRYSVPLTTWPDSLRKHVANMALHHLMRFRGFNPDGGDELIPQGYADAIRWLRDVSAQRITLNVPPVEHVAVQVSSGNPDDPDTFPPQFSRNWGDF